MKNLILTTVLVLFVGASASSQKCNSFKDCYDSGNNASGETAIAYLEKALKFAKKDSKNKGAANLALAKVYYKKIRSTADKKDINKAEKFFENSIDADPNNFFAYEWFINFYQLKAKDEDKGLEWGTKAIQKFPNYARAYYNRAHVYRYYNKLPQAVADLEKGASLLVSGQDDSGMEDYTLDTILYWKLLLENKQNKLKFYSKEDIATIEKYVELFPNSATLWGELALAYFDDGNIEEAITTGNRAWVLDGERIYNDYNGKSVGGYFIKAYQDFQNKDYKSAAFRFTAAENDDRNDHILPVYYRALGNFFYYVELLPNKWKNVEAQVKRGFEQTIKDTEGTKYQYLADNAKAQLEAINNPNSTAGQDETWPRDFEEFKINFNPLPSSYTLNYNTLQGRDITNLPGTRKLINSDEVNAIGLLCEGPGGYAFLVMTRTYRSNSQSTSFSVLTTDVNGKKLGYKRIASTQKDMGRVTITGIFSYTRTDAGFTINGTNTYKNGHKRTESASGSCN